MTGTGMPSAPALSPRRRAVRSFALVGLCLVLVLVLLLPSGIPGPIASGSAGPRLSAVALPDLRSAPSTISHLRPSSTGTLAPTGTTTFRPESGPWLPLGPAEGLASPISPRGPSAEPPEAIRALAGPHSAPVATITVQAKGSSPAQLTVGTSFEGENYYQCPCTPPDIQTAAGPTQVAEMVNLELAVWSTSGTKVGNESLFTFWGVSSSSAFLSDPKIIYDPDSGRWFASILEYTTSNGYTSPFAVSASSDVESTWKVYSSLHPYGGDLGDQPILGVSHDLLSIGVNDFGSSTYDGAQYWVINKTAVLNNATAAYASFGPYSADTSIHPVRAVQSMDGMFLGETFVGTPGVFELFSVSGVPPATVGVTRTNLTVGNLTYAPSAAQPGTTDTLDTGAGSVRPSDAVWGSGHLWATYPDSCTVGGATHACFRVDEINTSGTVSVAQDFDVAVSGTDLLYAALTLDPAGDVVIVFGMSSSSTHPSIAATYQAASGPSSTVHPGVLLKAGSASMTCGGTCRYGDYFGAALEPGTDRVWLAGEYVTGSAPWQSYLSSVVAQGPMAAALAVNPSSGDVGQALDLSVQVTNSTCPSGGAYGCSVVLPFGDGATATANCTRIGASVSFPHAYANPGTYAAGLGGSVTAFSTSNCASGTAVGTYNLTPVSVAIASAQVVSLSAAPSGSADVGENLTISAHVSGGVGPYYYLWSGLPPGCSTTTGPTVDCTLQASGDFAVHANSTDANGATVGATLSVHVDPAPSLVLVGQPLTTDVGQVLQVLGTPAGGSGSYTYAWAGLPTGCVGPVDSPSLTCTPGASGTFTVAVHITDSRGISNSSAPLRLKINPALSASLPATQSFAADVDFTLQPTVGGGTGPLAYSWTGLPSGCPSPSTANVTCNAPAGTYTVTVTVTDSVGARVQATTQIVVTGPAIGPGGIPITWLALLLVAIAAAAAIVIVLVVRRRRTPPTGAPVKPRIG